MVADGVRQCLLCGEEKTSPEGKGEWNWKRHLSRCHPYFLTEEESKVNYSGKKPQIDAPSSAASDSEAATPAAAALEAGVETLRDRRRLPSKSQAITNFFAPGTSVRQIDLSTALAQLSIEGGHAFRLTETTALQRYTQTVSGPSAKLVFPSRTTVMRVAGEIADNIVTNLGKILAVDMAPNDHPMVALSGLRGKVALTADGWTDTNLKAYLAVSAHWVSKSVNKLVKAPIGLAEFHSPHTTERLLALVKRLAYKFGLSDSESAKLEHGAIV